ncbi:hypothetical protein SLEP1_g39762 [Rubroshorea leprosula]|uniref:Uncharacterized protein n=1 Tax=Rubroshorea leprosula TaxID=152421 RepID=A0AAV5L187_9ROSI|nr:hypothetical protein SLEP1_g39762 [Rubroshorea leprosula]
MARMSNFFKRLPWFRILQVIELLLSGASNSVNLYSFFHTQGFL